MYNKLYYKYTVNEEGININIELAGKSKEDVKVFKEHDAILVKFDDKKYTITYDDFVHKSKYDYDAVKAKMKNGLLTITVPKNKKLEQQIQIE
jgi:HSP20 family molecular chaperone IbpA